MSDNVRLEANAKDGLEGGNGEEGRRPFALEEPRLSVEGTLGCRRGEALSVGVSLVVCRLYI